MKIFFFYIFIALLVLAIQATLLKGTKPEFILILVYFYSLRYGQIKGMTYGALTGLLIDSTSGFILGTNIISKAVVGYFSASLKQRIFQWNIIINTVMIAVFSVVDILLVYICLKTFAGITFFNRPLKISIMQVVYTTVAALMLYPVLNPEKDENWELRTRK